MHFPYPCKSALGALGALGAADLEGGGLPPDAQLSESALGELRESCADFAGLCARVGIDITRDLPDSYSLESFGHDFWLTRNRHGAGFWDRGELIAVGLAERLTELAHTYSESSLYPGDDGLIHHY